MVGLSASSPCMVLTVELQSVTGSAYSVRYAYDTCLSQHLLPVLSLRKVCTVRYYTNLHDMELTHGTEVKAVANLVKQVGLDIF